MYIYNITTNVDESIHDSWFDWMNEDHVPKIIEAGKFKRALMSQVLIKEEMGGITYSVQFVCESKELLEKYLLEKEQSILKEGRNQFGNKLGSFTTIMKIVNEFKEK